VAAAEHFKKMGLMAQMEITPLEGDNAFSGRPNLHPELPQANIVALFYTAYDVASRGGPCCYSGLAEGRRESLGPSRRRTMRWMHLRSAATMMGRIRCGDCGSSLHLVARLRTLRGDFFRVEAQLIP